MEEQMLFHKYQVFALQRHVEQQAKEAVRGLPEERLDEDDERLTSETVEQFTPAVPTIDPSQIYQTDRQIQLDARLMPNRMFLNRVRPVPVPGTEITIHVPFNGDPTMFDVCPSSHTTTWPFGTIDAENSEVLLTYRTADINFPVKARYEETLRDIRQYLEWLNADMPKFASLRQVVRSELAKRRQAASTHSKLAASTGVPRRPDRHAS